MEPILRFINPSDVGNQIKMYRKSLEMTRRQFTEHIKTSIGYSITEATLFAWETKESNRETMLLVMFALDMVNKETGSRLSGIVGFGDRLVE